MAEHRTRPQGLKLGVLAVAMLTAACVGRREPVREAAPRSPTAAPQVFRPAPGETQNRVAVLVPLTGPNAGVGTSIANAAKLALLDAGETRIKLTVYDTGTGAEAAANAALAAGNGLILGPLTAEEVRVAAPLAKVRGVPVLAFSNDVGVAGAGTYVMGTTPDQSIARAVRYARDKGATRFAGLIPIGDYGKRAGPALTRAVADAGGRLVAAQGYGRDTASLTAAMRTLNARGAYDAVVIADTSSIAAGATVLVRSGPSRGARIVGTELWSTDRTIGGKAALRGAIFAGVPDARFDQLVTRYRARYGKTPYRLGSLGYDAALLAVRINRDWTVGAPFPDRLLLGSDGFSGVDGAFRFNADGTAERRLAVHEVTAAGPRVVSPAQAGFGD